MKAIYFAREQGGHLVYRQGLQGPFLYNGVGQEIIPMSIPRFNSNWDEDTIQNQLSSLKQQGYTGLILRDEANPPFAVLEEEKKVLKTYKLGTNPPPDKVLGVEETITLLDKGYRFEPSPIN